MIFTYKPTIQIEYLCKYCIYFLLKQQKVGEDKESFAPIEDIDIATDSPTWLHKIWDAIDHNEIINKLIN